MGRQWSDLSPIKRLDIFVAFSVRIVIFDATSLDISKNDTYPFVLFKEQKHLYFGEIVDKAVPHWLKVNWYPQALAVPSVAFEPSFRGSFRWLLLHSLFTFHRHLRHRHSHRCSHCHCHCFRSLVYTEGGVRKEQVMMAYKVWKISFVRWLLPDFQRPNSKCSLSRLICFPKDQKFVSWVWDMPCTEIKARRRNCWLGS